MFFFVITVQTVPVPGQLIVSGKPSFSLAFPPVQLPAQTNTEEQSSYRYPRCQHTGKDTQDQLAGKSGQTSGSGNTCQQYNCQNRPVKLPSSFYPIDPEFQKIFGTLISGSHIHSILLLRDPVSFFIQLPDFFTDILYICRNFFFFFFEVFFTAGRLCQISFSGHFQHLHGTSHINRAVAGSLIAGHIILQFTDKILSGNTFQLCHGYGIIIDRLTYISENRLKSSLFRIHKASVIFTEKFSHFLFFIKISCKAIILSFTCKPHDPTIFGRIFPGFIFRISIILCSFATESADTVKHGSYKCMRRCLTALVFSEIFYFQTSDNHLALSSRAVPFTACFRFQAMPEDHNTVPFFLPYPFCPLRENSRYNHRSAYHCSVYKALPDHMQARTHPQHR